MSHRTLVEVHNQVQQFAPSALGHVLRSCRCARRYAKEMNKN